MLSLLSCMVYSLTCLQETEGVHEPLQPRGEYNAAIMLPTKMELAKTSFAGGRVVAQFVSQSETRLFGVKKPDGEISPMHLQMF